MTVTARHPLARSGLRTRLTLAFGVGGLLLATILAALTYGLTRSYLVRQREGAAIRAARSNAQAVAAGLRGGSPDVPAVLDALGSRTGSETLVLVGDAVFGSEVSTTLTRLPPAFLDRLRSGDAIRQRVDLGSTTYLAVGFPLSGGDTRYVEVFSLAELDRTLRTLSSVLVAAAAITTLGFGLLGFWVSRRVLTPLRDVAAAAGAIAEGRLDTRLDVGPDRDLQPLAGSFNAMADALQRRIERDARFAADVSHELRSPLTTLATSVGVLEANEEQLTDRPRQALRLLARELDRFVRLVEDLLEISRADASASLVLEEVSLDDLVHNAIVRSPYAEVPTALPEAGALVVRADRRRLERVLMNLLDNARSHAGGAVLVSVRRAGDAARLEVDDAGPGVAADERSRVFERFSRGRTGADRSRAGGVGLGLALVAEHVRSQGGRVWVEDRPGGGARFVVELPVVRA
jgi:two-component system, OmpR family, sensor histidine kinase MtrB